MCIMAQPVRSVSNTRIFVGCNRDRTRQLTIYEMAVQLQTPGNAMILPVPASRVEEVSFIDMTAAHNFFDRADSIFVERTRTKSMSLSRGIDFLPVQTVGNYQVSVAPTVGDLSRVNPEVFTLSPSAQTTLNDYSQGFVFVVAAMQKSGKFHPLAYTSPLSYALFVPTRHDHGEGRAAGALWDHYIYRQQAAVFSDLPGRNDNTEIRSKRSAPSYNLNQIQNWATDQVSAVPELAPFLEAGESAKVLRTKFQGRLRNIDLHLEL